MTHKLVSRSETVQIKWKNHKVWYFRFLTPPFLNFEKIAIFRNQYFYFSLFQGIWRFKRYIGKQIWLSKYTAFWTILLRKFCAFVEVCKWKIVEMRAWYVKLCHIQIRSDESRLIMLWQSLTKLSAKSSILKLQTSTKAQNFRNKIEIGRASCRERV